MSYGQVNMLHFSPVDKRATILNAALQVFTTYGFRKTSMDDIARAAGMSRPALYQVFKNKTEIFRGLVQHMMAEAMERAAAQFEEPGDFRDKLWGAIEQSILEIHRYIDDTPHGKELIGISDEIAPDISESWTVAMAELISQGVERCQAEGSVDLSRFHADPHTIGRVFVFALEGIKQEVECGRPIEQHIRSVVDFFADAVHAHQQEPVAAKA